MMNPKRRFKKADGTIFADWKNVPFANIFQEYNVKNTACLPQYTAGKYGLKPIDNEKIRYNIQNHKAFSINSLILGIGIEEVGVATNYPGCVSPIYTTYQIQDHKANSLFIAYYIKNVFAKNKGRITHKSTRREYEFEPTELKKIDIPLPDSLEEQEKIANFLFEIDNLIASAEAEIEKTKNFKKAMLQKMFPKDGESVPEIRFPGFTDDWEQRKLSDLTDNIDTGKSKFKSKETGAFEILGSTSVIGYDDTYDYEGDFLLTARVGANAGNLYRHAGKVKISDNTVFIQGSHIDFLYYLLERFDIKKLSFGTGQPLVKASELRNLSLIVPREDKEKDEIGRYFKSLDNLITLHQRKLDELNQFKKGMLQKMFV